jgi:hypothetical protein
MIFRPFALTGKPEIGGVENDDLQKAVQKEVTEWEQSLFSFSAPPFRSAARLASPAVPSNKKKINRPRRGRLDRKIERGGCAGTVAFSVKQRVPASPVLIFRLNFESKLWRQIGNETS